MTRLRVYLAAGWYMMGMAVAAPTTPERGPAGYEAGHQYAAWDCENPRTVKAMALPEECGTASTDSGRMEGEMRHWKVLQDTEYFQYQATACTMRRSKLTFSCAWKSHFVLAFPPETYRKVRTQVGDCDHWAKTSQYRATNGKMIPLVGHGLENNIRVVTEGEIKITNGFPHCQGVPMSDRGDFLYEGVAVEDINIVLRTVTVRERYLTGHRQIIEDDVEVSAEAVHNGGAIGPDSTYVFQRPEVVPCSRMVTKTFNARLTQQQQLDRLVLVDEVAQIHISAKTLTDTPAGCPSGNGVKGYYSTGHKDISVVEVVKGSNPPGLVNIDPRQIHMGPLIDLKSEWVLFVTAQRMRELAAFQGNQKCNELKAMWDDSLPTLQDESEKLLLRRGELTYAITCQRKKVVLDHERKNDKLCYHFLPVIATDGNGNPQQRFLTPGARLLVNSSSVEDCGVARISPRGFRTLAGTWTAMQPALVVLRDPSPFDITMADMGIDKSAQEAMGGAYRPEDLFQYSLAYEWELRTKAGRSFAEQVTTARDHGNMWSRNNPIDHLDDYFGRIEVTMPNLWTWFTNHVLPWINMVGNACSVFMFFLGLAIACIAVRRYIEDSRAHALVVNTATIFKLLCCSPLAAMTDPDYRASIASYAVGQVEDQDPEIPRQPAPSAPAYPDKEGKIKGDSLYPTSYIQTAED